MNFLKKHTLWVAVLVSVALMLPTVFQGFIVDDPMLLSVIEERYPERPHSFDIYSVLLHQAELFWWTQPDIEIKFFRPLGSALLRLDHAVFGSWAVGWHLHSIFWLVAFLGVSALFFRQLDPRLAGWMVLIFALDESFAHTAGWISNRHALTAMTFGVGALWAHLRFREDGWRPGLPLSCIGFILALLTAETGLVPLAFVGAYELFAAPGDLRRRAVGLAPPLTIGLVYAAWYRAMGYGFHGGAGIYIDPGADPLLFLREASVRIPTLLGGAVLGPPPDLWLQPSARPALFAVGIAATALITGCLYLGRRHLPEPWDRHLRWLLPGALLSCVPLVATFPSHRQTAGPMLGVAPAVVLILSLVWNVWRPAGGWRKASATAVGLLLITAHFVVAPMLRLASPQGMGAMHEGFVKTLETVPAWDPAEGFEEIVVLQAPDGMTSFYGPVFLDDMHDVRRGHWKTLSAAPADHRWTRTGPRHLELEILGDDQMLTTFAESAWPIRDGLAPGREIEHREVLIRILETGDQGPTRVAFELPRDLDDPELLLIAWIDGGFARVAPPAVGESFDVAYTPGYTRLPGG